MADRIARKARSDPVGLPALDITVTADGYEGIPDSIEAGRYLVFVEILGQLAGPPDESGVGSAAATPVEGGVATPEGEGGDMGVPPFVFESWTST